MVATIVSVCVAYCVTVICGSWLRERRLFREEMRDVSIANLRKSMEAGEKRHHADLEQLGTTLGELAGKVTKLSNKIEMRKGGR